MDDVVLLKEHRKADVRRMVLIPQVIALYRHESVEISMSAAETFRAAPVALEKEAGLSGGGGGS